MDLVNVNGVGDVTPQGPVAGYVASEVYVIGENVVSTVPLDSMSWMLNAFRGTVFIVAMSVNDTLTVVETITGVFVF
jgi:hypothetical protein